MIKVCICGGSGYTGIELLRILSHHPGVVVTGATSEKSAGKKVSDLFPHLAYYKNLVYEPLDRGKLLEKAEVFFLALPHGASQETVHFFFSKNKKVIDLSADYRLSSPALYEKWYGIPHAFVQTLKKAVYGLPELYRKRIRRARLIANPGCYPTGAILALIPALKGKMIDVSSIIIDSKSGTSGAGRKADVAVSYCEVNEGFRAYSVGTHRHTPEIEQELSLVYGKDIRVNFTPHLLPLDRGILSTVYAPLAKKATPGQIVDAYHKAYKNEPFVRVLDYGKYPNIKNVRGTNHCEIGLKLNERTHTLIVITAIDNLVKGASGQAVHNMNLMLGFEETTALDTLALYP
ncbi:MAG: N-acetyl-gamma-glutamyl-phosphate reductase [Thermodesulfovibrionales bacterium]|nr:N-acetyl-gamma-glutamyl-phosphate reductase [Thermodesulfovibrionales bacterium]